MAVGGAKPDLVSRALGSSHRSGGAPDPADAAGTVVRWEKPVDILSREGAAVWDTLVPPLLEARVLRPEDIILVVECCETWGLAHRFRTELQNEMNGLNDPDTVKKIRASWIQTLTQARSLMSELGLGPVSRARLGFGRTGGGLLDKIPMFGENDE